MNYSYEVVLANGKTFYATSGKAVYEIGLRIRDHASVEFDNAVVATSQIAAVVVWDGKSLFGPSKG